MDYRSSTKREYDGDGMIAKDFAGLADGEKITARELGRRHGYKRKWGSHHAKKFVKDGIVICSGRTHCCEQTYMLSNLSLTRATLHAIVEWWADHTERTWRKKIILTATALTRYISSRFSRRKGRVLKSDGCFIPFKDSLVVSIGEVLVASDFAMDFDSFRGDSLSLLDSGEKWYLKRYNPSFPEF